MLTNNKSAAVECITQGGGASKESSENQIERPGLRSPQSARIAYLSAIIPSLSETFIYREIEELQRRGFNIMTYSLWRPEREQLSAESIKHLEVTHYLRPLILSQVVRSHVKIFFAQPIVYCRAVWSMVSASGLDLTGRWRSILHFAEAAVLADRLIRDRIQHVHAHYASQPASVARAIYLLTGIQYSFSAHAHDIWLDRLMLKTKVKECRFVSCCSEYGRQWLLRECNNQYSEKIHLVYHGLDVRKFGMSGFDGPREKNHILTVGRLTEQKGFPVLIKACAILQSRNIPFRCSIVGQGEQLDELRSLIHEHGLNNCVKLTGPLPQEKVRELYHQAWLFCLPCIDCKDGNRDGIPNVLMEAMASGLPVITTTNSGQAELIQNEVDGLLLNPGDPRQLADALERLCSDQTLRDQIVKAARTKMEKMYDSRKTIEALVKLFEKNCPL